MDSSLATSSLMVVKVRYAWMHNKVNIPHTEMTRLSLVTTMSTIDKVVTTLWIGCYVKLRLSSLCYNLACRLSQVSDTRSQP